MGRWPLMIRGLVIAVCGVLLGIGGCLGFIATVDSSEALAFIGGGAFLIGVVTILAGGVMVIIGVFKWFFAAIASQPK
jgi:hypothetical protein